jgi:trehalose-6-phosphatase
MATEILPDLGFDKGTAVRFIVRRLGDTCTVLYAGDHANDADAFTMTNALKGIALGIGPNAPDTARYCLPDPATLTDFLQQLLEHLAGSEDGQRAGGLRDDDGHSGGRCGETTQSRLASNVAITYSA